MLGRAEHALDVALLDDLALAHDADAVGELAHDAEVVDTTESLTPKMAQAAAELMNARLTDLLARNIAHVPHLPVPAKPDS